MKTILITGATSGIGKALAIHCAEQGYLVTACGRNEERLNELSKISNIDVLQFDVTDKQHVKSSLEGKRFDITVLNAGVCEYVDTDSFDSQMFERVFAANFFGVIYCIEALLPRLEAGNQLVMVDSLARLLPFTRSQAYGGSKAALHYVTKSLTVDLAAKGVIVQSVSPGFVETPLTAKNDFDMPMSISVDKAVSAMLLGIEAKRQNIYFPRRFSAILRLLSLLPSKLKVKISQKMKHSQQDKE